MELGLGKAKYEVVSYQRTGSQMNVPPAFLTSPHTSNHFGLICSLQASRTSTQQVSSFGSVGLTIVFPPDHDQVNHPRYPSTLLVVQGHLLFLVAPHSSAHPSISTSIPHVLDVPEFRKTTDQLRVIAMRPLFCRL